VEILPNKQQEYEKSAADEHLYETFKKIGSLQAYEYLNGNLEYRGEQKRQFIAGKIQNPNLDYPEIDSDELNQIEFELVSMKKM